MWSDDDSSFELLKPKNPPNEPRTQVSTSTITVDAVPPTETSDKSHKRVRAPTKKRAAKKRKRFHDDDRKMLCDDTVPNTLWMMVFPDGEETIAIFQCMI